MRNSPHGSVLREMIVIKTVIKTGEGSMTKGEDDHMAEYLWNYVQSLGSLRGKDDVWTRTVCISMEKIVFDLRLDEGQS